MCPCRAGAERLYVLGRRVVVGRLCVLGNPGTARWLYVPQRQGAVDQLRVPVRRVRKEPLYVIGRRVSAGRLCVLG